MARYYNAETLLEFVKQYTPHINGETTMECVETAILNAPTADVVEVKHGEWTIKQDEYGCEYMVCSCCAEWFYDGENDTVDRTPKYCSECGAKMDGRRDT